MNNKQITEKYLKYNRLNSGDQMNLIGLQRFFDMKRASISYHFKKGYISPKNNIEGLNYSLSELIKQGVSYDFVEVKYNFSYTGTKFVDFYVKIGVKYYLKAFNMGNLEEIKEYKEFKNILLSK